MMRLDESLELNENLQICLLATLSRCPLHSVDINEAVLGPQQRGAKDWSIPDLLKQFGQACPALLRDSARLVIDERRSELYLVDRSEKIPALWIHCRGKIPACSEHTLTSVKQ